MSARRGILNALEPYLVFYFSESFTPSTLEVFSRPTSIVTFGRQNQQIVGQPWKFRRREKFTKDCKQFTVRNGASIYGKRQFRFGSFKRFVGRKLFPVDPSVYRSRRLLFIRS